VTSLAEGSYDDAPSMGRHGGATSGANGAAGKGRKAADAGGVGAEAACMRCFML
jgi:hypothetical protein